MFGTRTLWEGSSKYNNKIKVVKGLGLGTYIQVNGLTQSGGIVEDIWNKTIRHLKGLKTEVGSVLILGLGGGTLVKVIHKYFKNAKITGVEIDKKMVDLGKKYLDLKDVSIIIDDAINYKSKKVFDLVIVDLYTGDEYPKKFETVSFIKTLSRHKVVIFNRLYYKEKKIKSEKFRIKLEKIFHNIISFKPPANVMYVCGL